MNVNELVSKILEGDQFEYELFWKFASKIGVCSQWYTGDGFSSSTDFYVSAEHYMMIGKAELFNQNGQNDDIIKTMRATLHPREVKRLGRQVKGFDEAIWNENRMDIVVVGNYLKFSQDCKLRKVLFETGDAILVEASPYDPIWGIGLEESHIDSRTPSKWKGLNLLGFALMEVRDMLREKLDE